MNRMKILQYILTGFAMSLLLLSCSSKKSENPYRHLQLSSVQQWVFDRYKISPFRMHCEWDSLCKSSVDDPAYVDDVVRSYYSAYKPLKWITFEGVNPAADTLLIYLSKVKDHGLDARNFYIGQIKDNLERFRSFTFDKEHTVSKVAARLDFYLTKAYYRYASGMYFGFVNPYKIYNSLEVRQDSTPVRLYDVKSDICGPNFIRIMDGALTSGRINAFLKSIQPASAQYYRLQRAFLLRQGNSRLLRINMERLRWHVNQPMEGKYVLVNIPSQRLWAVNQSAGNVLTMRVCCGSTDSKTPQLDSKIYRVELNPFWIVPRSIIKHGISLSPAYLTRKRMRIIERATGKEVPPSAVTKDLLMQPDAPYLVRQDNGEGNSLGRMIFRFHNAFSIFLHDTSDKNAFDNGSRDVSHGCIRVEKPLQLAVFLLPKADGQIEQVFRTAITRPNPTDKDGKPLPLRSTYQSYNPPVSLFIRYYTAFPDPVSGKIRSYPDIYGFDDKIWEKLRYW